MMKNHGVEYDLMHDLVYILYKLVVLISIVVKLKLEDNQMDVSTALLDSTLDDVIYILQPSGFEHLVPIGK